jgi:hypothetical protein
MAHGDAWEGKLRGNWRMEWVVSTLHTTSEHGVCSVTTADAHTSAASSRLNWWRCRFKWTRPFRRKTKSGFCACAITFQTHSTGLLEMCGYRVKADSHMQVCTQTASLRTPFESDLSTLRRRAEALQSIDGLYAVNACPKVRLFPGYHVNFHEGKDPTQFIRRPVGYI